MVEVVVLLFVSLGPRIAPRKKDHGQECAEAHTNGKREHAEQERTHGM